MRIMSHKCISALSSALFVVMVFTGLLSASPAFAGDKVLEASYTGTFEITFGTGPNGTSELHFNGVGADSINGDSTVVGYSTTVPASTPNCFDIITDMVTIADAHSGHELDIENAGGDCLDFSDPTAVYVVGSGTSVYTGGTGRFKKAGGVGVWEVRARVDAFLPTGLSGTIEFINFSGLVEHQN